MGERGEDAVARPGRWAAGRGRPCSPPRTGRHTRWTAGAAPATGCSPGTPACSPARACHRRVTSVWYDGPGAVVFGAQQREVVVAHSGKKNADEALVLALATGVSVPDAAGRAGVSTRTAYRRLEDPGFRRRVDQARSDLVNAAIGRLSAIGAESVAEVERLVRESKSEAVRLGAVRTVLEYLFRGNEQYTLARQVDELRRQLEGVKRGNRDPAPRAGPAPAGDPGAGAGGQPGDSPGGGGPEPAAGGSGADPRPVAED